MAIKKLKPAIDLIQVPEGYATLPTPLVLFKKTTGELWANPSFNSTFGNDALQTFGTQKGIGLIQERPVTTAVFALPGRHEGFVMVSTLGKKTPVELKVSPHGKPEDDCFLVLFEEVSAKVELQKQLIQNHLELQKSFEQLNQTQAALIQSAKLASLGELSSGIAHELNQPLQAIMGFSQELQYMEKLTPTGTEFLADIVNASKKMAEIIKSLRSFAREAGEDITPTSVEHAIKESSRLMHHTFMQSGIGLELHCDESLPLIPANPIQLEQVFVNLMSNAKDAIEQAHPGSGKISISATLAHDEIIVKVSDNGCGMSAETQQKIFDPFFTTKPVGKGTGLGMSITYGILKKLGVRISVQSTLGQGTEFTLVFKTQSTTQEGDVA